MSKTVVITGANRGIGLSLVKHYVSKGCEVYALCRKAFEDLHATSANIIEAIDVSADNLQQKLTTALQGVEIDLLINNAGVLRNEVLGDVDYKSIRDQFEVNALGPLKVTECLLSQLSSSAKVMMVTSRMGSIADNTSGGRYGYRMSKVALNIASVSLAHDLRSQGIAVGIVHPGLVGTDMIGGFGDITPDEAATRIATRVDELCLENTGTFWHSNGEILPW